MAQPQPVRVLHFADAHIDIANYGKHDPDSLLPVRVVDFLTALDQIVDHAITEKVDLVIFAGDAYKDRNPHPTFQREWGKRMMRLSHAEIPTILLVGNHDVSPAAGRAHALHEYRTLSVPYIHVADRIELLSDEKLGIPIQVVAVPWVSRNALLTREDTAGKSLNEVLTAIEEKVIAGIERILAEQRDPHLPTILTAHATVQGAVYGGERAVMLGHELVIGGRIVTDKRLDYVALGHIHKHQQLNPGLHPPVVYPGSIERVNFGEIKEHKGFVMAQVTQGQTTWQFVKLDTRPFRDFEVDIASSENFMAQVMNQLPPADKLTDSICRLTLYYAKEWESLLDEPSLHTHFKEALSFQLVKRYHRRDRARLGDTVAVSEMSPLALLDQYWLTTGLPANDIEAMQSLAKEIFTEDNQILT